jgi:precorrin-2 dehydrogenase/sirohydrochlorin ferrochelatase
MGYYPVFLKLDGRPCVVIGGGVVAERKVEGLLQVGAAVTVISPNLTERLRFWVTDRQVSHLAREYQSGDLAGHELVFVATDNHEVNKAVFGEALERGVWVNAADDPSHCDFVLPSVLRRGELVVAVATGGSSPALSQAIRKELDAYFTEDYVALSEIVAEVRRELRERSFHAGAEVWREALDGKMRRLVKEGKQKEARDYLFVKLGAESCK